MITEKQLIANQQNSLLSTGAITPEGKAIVAKNAIKHGIFAKTFLVNHEKYQENISDYEELLHNLEVDLEPVGQMENMLVEKIAVDYWRIKRVLKFETDGIYDNVNQVLNTYQYNEEIGKHKRVFIDYYIDHPGKSDKIIRYETHLQRQILQNITLLKQLQATRRNKMG